jgi:ABC-type nickel/cobalt efflux system permease component RcnA
VRTTARILLVGGALLAGAAAAQAATSPFGIATPDGGGGLGGPLGPFFAWIAVHQAHFYRALTGALGSLKQDPRGLWLLLGLSFAYGVFHAVGPGHGKAVISSYLLASGDGARRGVALSFAAALVQAASAILVVAVGAIILRISATAMTLATDWIEIVSYAAIAGVGAWMLWAKTFGGHHHHHHHHDAGRSQAPDHDHHHDRGERSHEPVAGRPPALWRAGSAIMAVGVRPCSGAIIVLVFALSQGLFAAGVAAALVMALGTGVTVAALATLPGSARGVAVTLAGSGSAIAYTLARSVEVGGAALILILGLSLLGGALSAGFPG